ncbi:hypothetical protein HDU92_006543, partial [Lobulomyces angularis]
GYSPEDTLRTNTSFSRVVNFLLRPWRSGVVFSVVDLITRVMDPQKKQGFVVLNDLEWQRCELSNVLKKTRTEKNAVV